MTAGSYGIYDVRGNSAESGRWIVRPEVPAAVPSAIVAFDLAFDTLRLSELRVTTVSSNQLVLSLNRKFGFRQTGITPAGRLLFVLCPLPRGSLPRASVC